MAFVDAITQGAVGTVGNVLDAQLLAHLLRLPVHELFPIMSLQLPLVAVESAVTRG